MKKISKRLIAIGITLVMMLSLVACGGSKDGEAKDENTLTVWAWDAQFNLYAMEEAEKIYQQKNPDFKLELVEITWDDLQTKLGTIIGSGDYSQLPDICLMQDYAYQKYVTIYDGLFQDITDSGIDFSQFAEGKLAASVVDGKNYGVPFDNGTDVAIYRTDVLEQAGYTIDDLTDIRKEKIAFVLLAVAKYYNNVSSDNNNRMYMSMSDLFKLSRVAIPCKERAAYLHFAYQEGILVEHTFVGTNLKVVAFVDNDSEPVIELSEGDYKELAYAYLNYKNGGYKYCKGCGKLFKMHKTSPGRLYCKECGQKEELSEFKAIKCVDCGEDVVVGALNTKTCRCQACQDMRNKELKSARNARYYEQHKN